MKRTRDPNRPIPLHDYSPALQTAMSWLGNRYLLAEPVNRRVVAHKPAYNETPRWHPVVWSTAPKVS